MAELFRCIANQKSSGRPVQADAKEEEQWW